MGDRYAFDLVDLQFELFSHIINVTLEMLVVEEDLYSYLGVIYVSYIPVNK